MKDFPRDKKNFDETAQSHSLLHNLDLKTAKLNAHIEEEVSRKQQTRFVKSLADDSTDSNKEEVTFVLSCRSSTSNRTSVHHCLTKL